MSRVERLRALAERGATPGERAAAARALAIHEAKVAKSQVTQPPVEQPVGPDTTRNGRPFRAREHDGLVWVAVRDSTLTKARARAMVWVAFRARLLVVLDGERLAMIPTAVEVDDERQQVHVTADRGSLEPWA